MSTKRLPSGITVGIVNIRARYHAVRRNLRITPDTPHDRLLPLIDIVLIPRDEEGEFRFSGLTLADSEGLKQWSPEDRRVFREWLQEEEQVREIGRARQRIVHGELPLSVQEYDYPGRLYSVLSRRLAALSMASAPPRQWRRTIFNLLQQGVRREEIIWSGVLEYLDSKSVAGAVSVTRDELVDRIDFSSTCIRLTNELVDDAPGLTDKTPGFRVARRHARRNGCSPRALYEYKTLAGGEDYREWLVTLPDYPLSFFSGHFYERNLLLHIRSKSRRDGRGRRLLFIEELQSDWHQSGAKHGYANLRWPNRAPRAPFRREWAGLAVKLMLLHAAESGFDGIAWTNGREQELQYFREMPAVRRLYDQELPRCFTRLGRCWNALPERVGIRTREPRLQADRRKDKWRVSDWEGTFRTRPRYTQKEAIELIARHCKSIELEVPVFWIPREMRDHILREGLPMFGETLVW